MTAIAPAAIIPAPIPVTGDSPVSNDNNLFSLISSAAVENALLSVNSDDDATVLGTNAITGTTGLDTTLLTNLNTEALLALNGVNNNDADATAAAGSTLTTTQTEEMAMLLNDLQMLAAIEATSNSQAVLNNGASIVNLSPEALDLLAEINSANGVSNANTLSPTQLQQAAAIVAPFLNQPLTPALITQIQNALEAAGFSPQQVSLANLFLTINFVAAETMPVSVTNDLATSDMVAAIEEA